MTCSCRQWHTSHTIYCAAILIRIVSIKTCATLANNSHGTSLSIVVSHVFICIRKVLVVSLLSIKNCLLIARVNQGSRCSLNRIIQIVKIELPLYFIEYINYVRACLHPSQTTPLFVWWPYPILVTKTASFGHKIFRYCAAKQWDSLPFHIHHLSSIESFKRGLKTHLVFEHYS